MKTFLRFFTVALLSAGVISCDKGGESLVTPPTPTPVPEADYLSVGTSSVIFAAVGGTQTVKVTADKTWTATPSAEWIVVTPPEEGTTTGTFVVSVAESTESLAGTIEVSDGSTTKTISVERDATLVGEHLVGHYVVDVSVDFTTSPTFFKLYLGAVDSRSYASGTGTFMNLEFRIPNLDFTKTSIDIPAGTYTISGSHIVPIVNGLSSGFDYYNKHIITSGTVTVKGNSKNYSILVNLTLIDGTEMQGYFIGPIFWNNKNPNLLSTLTEDFKLPTMTGGELSYMGDVYADDGDKYKDLPIWYLEMYTRGVDTSTNYLLGEGCVVQMTIAADKRIVEIDKQNQINLELLPDGTYPITDITKTDNLINTVFAGHDGVGYGCWIMLLSDDGHIYDKAPLRSGEVGISYNIKDGEYTIDIDALDNLGNKITGRYKGKLSYTDATSSETLK